jgi:hypothetical protein
VETAGALLNKKFAFHKNETILSERVVKLLNGVELAGINIESIEPGDRREMLTRAEGVWGSCCIGHVTVNGY